MALFVSAALLNQCTGSANLSILLDNVDNRIYAKGGFTGKFS